MSDSAEGVDPNVALFAQWATSEREREKAAQREAQNARRQAKAAEELTSNKQKAAAELKRLRASPNATAEQKAEAEAAYRAALAAVVEAETGAPPSWSPPPAVGDETPSVTSDEQSRNAGPPSSPDEGDAPDASTGDESTGDTP